ncbi:MAG: hypothetical protein GJU77_05480 [Ferrovum sp.]|jgi:hypothetical protein|nr:hypothetical protein [Ferrovum sp.]
MAFPRKGKAIFIMVWNRLLQLNNATEKNITNCYKTIYRLIEPVLVFDLAQIVPSWGVLHQLGSYRKT